MKLLLATLVILLAAVFLLRLRRRGANGGRKTGKSSAVDLTATTSRFHAVGIRPGSRACDAALGLHGQRFLSEAAPQLPLPSCNVAACRCRFVHFADRRSGDDRRSPFPATIGIDTGTYRQEQRQRTERRREPPESN